MENEGPDDVETGIGHAYIYLEMADLIRYFDDLGAPVWVLAYLERRKAQCQKLMLDASARLNKVGRALDLMDALELEGGDYEC